MPLYEYVCPNCQCAFEELRPLRDYAALARCPRCATDSRRRASLFTSNTVHLPGDARLPSQPAAHVGCSCCGPRRTRTTLRRRR